MDALPLDLQQERRRCVAADAARKRSARRWTNWDSPVPEKLLRRETVEFDIRHGLVPPPEPPAPAVPPAQLQPLLQMYESSSGTWSFPTDEEGGSSASPRTPMSRQVAVDEDGFQIYDPRAFEGSVGREDFVPKEVLATVTSAVQARSADEVQGEAKRRRREVDLDELMLEQGLGQDRLHREQEAAKAREKGKAVVIYVDDDSEGEE